MSLSNYKTIISRNISNLPGWKSKSRILVIESDDWGSIRMPSLKIFNELEKKGLDLRSADAERYNLNDTLASSRDLEKLFETLSSHKDCRGENAVFTAVSVMANPDFKKIKSSDFSTYYYEPFTETLQRTPGCEKSFEQWKTGIDTHLFVPQMHAREHLNVLAWMKALQRNEKQTRLAFESGMTGFVPENYPRVDYQSAFLLEDPNDIEFQKEVLVSGLELFEKIFGYKAEYFVPPNGPFNNQLNETLRLNGIKYRNISKIQKEPTGRGQYKKSIHWAGQKDKSGLFYITRNCFFEPNSVGKDWVDSCLKEIEIAFRYSKPAIISSHRANYIGSLHEKNRDMGLNQLNQLLDRAVRKWPDLHFMTTVEMGKFLTKK